MRRGTNGDSGDVVKGFTLNGFAALSSSVVLSICVSAAASQTDVRVPPQRSEMLVHSPLGACRSNGSREGADATRLRIATWNIRAARSAPLGDIAAEVAAMQADVIALQEVDVRTRRSGFVDEPAALAAALGFHYAFAASIRWDEGDYGLAVLSRWPLSDVRRHRLDATTAIEPRIVLEATACARGRPLRLFNHHADGWVRSRETGFAELRRILQAHMGRGLFVLGDLNEQPDGPGIRGLLETGLIDLGSALGPRAQNRRRIDYLLADPTLASASSPAGVWPTEKSDHHAMVADIEW